MAEIIIELIGNHSVKCNDTWRQLYERRGVCPHRIVVDKGDICTDQKAPLVNSTKKRPRTGMSFLRDFRLCKEPEDS